MEIKNFIARAFLVITNPPPPAKIAIGHIADETIVTEYVISSTIEQLILVHMVMARLKVSFSRRKQQ